MINPIVVSRPTRETRGGVEVHTTRHLYWCPGCDSLHSITVRPGKQSNGASWAFEGTLECPTYSPSQLTTWEGLRNGVETKEVCHTFIKAGMIQFLGDCTHKMAGQTVPLPPLPDWVIGCKGVDLGGTDE